MRTGELSFPSGRTADEIVLDDAAGLAWVANLGCIDLNPHPVRADDLDHPDELRVDLDPVPGVPWSQIREVALVAREALEAWGSSAGRRRRARAASTSTSGSSGAGRIPEVRRAALALARDVERRAPDDRDLASGGRRSATASSSTTTRTPRTGRSRRPTRSGRCPTRGSRCRSPGTRSRPSRPRRSRSATVPALASRATAIRGRASTRPSARWRRCSSCRARDEAEGLGDAPWPPNYAQAGRRAAPGPAVARSAGPTPSTTRPRPRRSARRPAPRWSGGSRGRDRAPGDAERRPAAEPAPAPGRPRPAAARSTVPVIEIAARPRRRTRRSTGLERWKARHPEVGRRARAGRRPGRRDARPLDALVPRSG